MMGNGISVRTNSVPRFDPDPRWLRVH